MQIRYAPALDGDRPILEEVFPNIPITTAVSVVVIDKATDTLVATSTGVATKSTQDTAVWFYDTADITGIDLDTVSFAQLTIRLRATFAIAGNIDRYQTLVVNGALSNLDAKSSDIETDTQNIQSRLPAALVGGRMDSDVAVIQSGVITAAVIATDAVDADAIAADAVTEIQSGLATAAALSTVQSDTDDIQTRLPAALVGGRMDSDVAVVQTGAITAAAIATDAIGSAELATTAVNEIRDAILTDSTSFNGADIATILSDTNDIQTRLPAALVSGKMDSDMTAISGDTAAADNLEATYDGSGYEDPVAPATQQQLDQIAITGAAINEAANADTTLTTGTTITGSVTDTAALDSVYWQIEDAAGTLDMYFEFLISSDGIPTTVTHTGRVNGVNDSLDVFAWNWAGAAWVQIGTLTGQATTTDAANTYTLFTSHVGTGTDVGKVRIRFQNTGLTSADFYTDQVFVSYAVVNRSVGYADGAIWIDTINGTAGTTSFINGTADNPVDSLADAVTLSGNLNINRFRVASGSSLTLITDKTNDTFIGDNWTLDLNGQAIGGTAIMGATISGVSSGADYVFDNCQIGTCTLDNGTLRGCGITGDVTLSAAGAYFFEVCYSGVAGTATPSIDFGAAVANTQLNMRHYSGGIEIKNMGGAGTDNMSLEGFGQLVINANCSGGTVAIRGTFTVTDNAGGAVTLSDDARLTRPEIADDVWDENIAGHAAADTFGNYVQTTLVAALNIQSRIPAALVGGRMDSDVAVIQANAITASAIATDAIGSAELATTAVNEIRDSILSDSTAFAGANIDATISSRSSHSAADAADSVWDEDIIAAHGTADTSGLLVRALGASISQRSNNPTLDALLGVADTASNDLPAQVDTELTATHDAGSWAGGGGLTVGAIADGVWDEAIADHVAAGSFGKDLQDKAVQSDILSDATPFAGGNIDVAISTRAQPNDPMDLMANALDSASLDISATNEIRDAILSDSTPFAGANIDAAISSRAAPGAAMDLVTDAVDSGSLATTAVNEVRDSILSDSTAFAGANIDAAITSRAAAGDAMDLIADAVDATSLATTAVNEIRDAILSDSTAFAGANVDASITSRSSHSAADAADSVWDENIVTAHGAASAAGLLLRVLGNNISTRANSPDLHTLLGVADSAGVDLPEQINTELEVTQSHGAGSWESASVTPSAVADAVWDEDIVAAHGTADTAGLLVRALGAVISQRTNNANLDALLDVTDTASNTLPQEVEDRILSDGIAFAGANVDAAISSRAVAGDAMDLVTDAVDSAAVATTGANEIRDSILSDSTAFPGANIDALISSRAAPGAQMDLLANSITSGVLAASATNEIRDSILSDSTAFAGANVDAAITTRSSHSAADVDTTLTASHGAGAWTTSLLTVGGIADAVWTELISDHESALNGTESAADTMAIIRKIMNNKLELASGGTTSNWVLFDDDDSTTLRTYDVSDKDGLALNLGSGAPAKRTRGT